LGLLLLAVDNDEGAVAGSSDSASAAPSTSIARLTQTMTSFAPSAAGAASSPLDQPSMAAITTPNMLVERFDETKPNFC